MRSLPIMLTCCLMTAGCEGGGMPDLPGPTLTDQYITYWAFGNEVRAWVTATSPDGPVTIACEGVVVGVGVDTSGVDNLSLRFPLGARSRSAGVTAHLDCLASAGDLGTPFTLTLDDPGVPDAAPVFDSLIVRSFVEADSVDPKTIGVRYIAHDDYRLTHWSVERSDSAACPCQPFVADTLLGASWVGVMFLYIYNDPGTYYFRFTLTDDADQSTVLWRGPLEVPLPE